MMGSFRKYRRRWNQISAIHQRLLVLLTDNLVTSNKWFFRELRNEHEHAFFGESYFLAIFLKYWGYGCRSYYNTWRVPGLGREWRNHGKRNTLINQQWRSLCLTEEDYPNCTLNHVEHFLMTIRSTVECLKHCWIARENVVCCWSHRCSLMVPNNCASMADFWIHFRPCFVGYSEVLYRTRLMWRCNTWLSVPTSWGWMKSGLLNAFQRNNKGHSQTESSNNKLHGAELYFNSIVSTTWLCWQDSKPPCNRKSICSWIRAHLLISSVKCY